MAALNRAVEPDQLLCDLLALDPGLRLVPYYGERAVFYNPDGAAPLGTILAAVKEHDGPNDRSARLSRPGVYRFAYGMTPKEFARRFGSLPRRPPKGGVVDLPGYDPARLDKLMPHPVYGWMNWVQILSPSPRSFESLSASLADTLAHVKVKWMHRKGPADRN